MYSQRLMVHLRGPGPSSQVLEVREESNLPLGSVDLVVGSKVRSDSPEPTQ